MHEENNTKTCPFCGISAKEIPSDMVYEDDSVFAFLDINPVNPGHTLIVPKTHYKDIYDTPDDVLCDISVAVKKVSIAVKKAVNADGINIWQNNDAPAGQAVFHTHFHIIPRFEDDGLRLWHGKPYKEGEGEKITQEIKTLLNK